MADLSFVLECLHELGLPRLSRTVLALLVLARRLEPLPSPAGRRRLLHKTAFTDDVVTCDQQNKMRQMLLKGGALRVAISCASASSPGARAAASSHSSAAFDAAIAACAAVACANRRRSDDT